MALSHLERARVALFGVAEWPAAEGIEIRPERGSTAGGRTSPCVAGGSPLMTVDQISLVYQSYRQDGRRRKPLEAVVHYYGAPLTVEALRLVLAYHEAHRELFDLHCDGLRALRRDDILALYELADTQNR
jgi:hypothetical protein